MIDRTCQLLLHSNATYRVRRLSSAFLFCINLVAISSFADRLQPGGTGSVGYNRVQPILQPMANMDGQSKTQYYAGKALAGQPWIKAPTVTTARDGLGPLYNARTCLACHVRGLRGSLPESQTSSDSFIVKLNLPGTDKLLGTLADPTYGDQIQTRSIDLFPKFSSSNGKQQVPNVPIEADIQIEWAYQWFTFSDGTRVQLRRPQVRLAEWAYGQPHKAVNYSIRNAPVLYGGGLLEQIPAAQILRNEDPSDRDADGISGRANRVWDRHSKAEQLGRFGWKANRSSVEQISAAAFANDIGITSSMFPEGSCTEKQIRCRELAEKTHPQIELSDDLLALTSYFVEHIAVPRAKPLSFNAQAGQGIFDQLGCSSCHVPTYKTAKNPAKPYLSEQVIWPYTDLLLHDMGEQLSDGRPEYTATESEWRTPPLWGMGSSQKVHNQNAYLLHDGRARTIEEAILWHGGEAQKAKQKFSQLSKMQRDQLIEFVLSL